VEDRGETAIRGKNQGQRKQKEGIEIAQNHTWGEAPKSRYTHLPDLDEKGKRSGENVSRSQTRRVWDEEDKHKLAIVGKAKASKK